MGDSEEKQSFLKYNLFSLSGGFYFRDELEKMSKGNESLPRTQIC